MKEIKFLKFAKIFNQQTNTSEIILAQDVLVLNYDETKLFCPFCGEKVVLTTLPATGEAIFSHPSPCDTLVYAKGVYLDLIDHISLLLSELDLIVLRKAFQKYGAKGSFTSEQAEVERSILFSLKNVNATEYDISQSLETLEKLSFIVGKKKESTLRQDEKKRTSPRIFFFKLTDKALDFLGQTNFKESQGRQQSLLLKSDSSNISEYKEILQFNPLELYKGPLNTLDRISRISGKRKTLSPTREANKRVYDRVLSYFKGNDKYTIKPDLTKVRIPGDDVNLKKYQFYHEVFNPNTDFAYIDAGAETKHESTLSSEKFYIPVGFIELFHAINQGIKDKKERLKALESAISYRKFYSSHLDLLQLMVVGISPQKKTNLAIEDIYQLYVVPTLTTSRNIEFFDKFQEFINLKTGTATLLGFFDEMHPNFYHFVISKHFSKLSFSEGKGVAKITLSQEERLNLGNLFEAHAQKRFSVYSFKGLIINKQQRKRGSRNRKESLEKFLSKPHTIKTIFALELGMKPSDIYDRLGFTSNMTIFKIKKILKQAHSLPIKELINSIKIQGHEHFLLDPKVRLLVKEIILGQVKLSYKSLFDAKALWPVSMKALQEFVLTPSPLSSHSKIIEAIKLYDLSTFFIQPSIRKSIQDILLGNSYRNSENSEKDLPLSPEMLRSFLDSPMSSQNIKYLLLAIQLYEFEVFLLQTNQLVIALLSKQPIRTIINSGASYSEIFKVELLLNNRRVEELIKAFHYNQEYIQTKPIIKKHFFEKAQVQLIIEALGRGDSPTFVAEKLGISYESILKVAYAINKDKLSSDVKKLINDLKIKGVEYFLLEKSTQNIIQALIRKETPFEIADQSLVSFNKILQTIDLINRADLPANLRRLIRHIQVLGLERFLLKKRIQNILIALSKGYTPHHIINTQETTYQEVLQIEALLRSQDLPLKISELIKTLTTPYNLKSNKAAYEAILAQEQIQQAITSYAQENIVTYLGLSKTSIQGLIMVLDNSLLIPMSIREKVISIKKNAQTEIRSQEIFASVTEDLEKRLPFKVIASKYKIDYRQILTISNLARQNDQLGV